MNYKSFLETLTQIQEEVKLKEENAGLLRILATIFRFQDESIRKISQESSIPVPICVAIRNEFGKVNWIQKTKKGAKLTTTGKQVLETLGGLNENFQCSDCRGSGVAFPYKNYATSLAIIDKYCQMRGTPNTQIDQSFATSKTNLSRILYMSHKFDLFWKNYAFIGDSDLTSVALALFAPPSSKIVIFDIDTRIKQIIDVVNSERNLDIQFVKHDFREPISEEYHASFDCVLTDPPYTRNGCNLFISRGIELLSKEKTSVIYLSFTNKPPQEMLAIEQDLLNMGCLITEIKPRFNEYVGAQKLGGISTFYRLEAIPPFSPIITDFYEGPLYTGEMITTIRTYQCLQCSNKIKIGYERNYNTIEELKAEGCPHCNHNMFRKISEKKIE